MSILIDDSTRVIVQGITGRIGSIQTRWMLAYGTKVVAGVTSGKGGSTVEGVPVFGSVEEAVKETGANASVFFVPAAFVLDAFLETVDAGVKLIVVVPEHIPVHDVMKMRAYAIPKGILALGPTTLGILVPGKGKMGIMPASLFAPGRVGIISRSGALSYEFAGILSEGQVGQTTVVGMGADPVVLTNLVDILRLFEEDRGTDAVIIVGEVGGGTGGEGRPVYPGEDDQTRSRIYCGPLLPPRKANGPCWRYCSWFCRDRVCQTGGLA
jgi:succinyl-CoA synthetase alpha subunit